MSDRALELSVDRELEGIVKHSWQDLPQYLRALVEARIGVHLNEPNGEVMIHHEVVSKYLKAAIAVVWIQLSFDGIDGLDDDELYVLYDILADADGLLALLDELLVVMFIQILLKLVEIELVTVLKAPVAPAILLDSVVGQMNILVLTIVEFVFDSCCSQVPVLEEEHLHVLVDQYPNPNVKLALVDQKRPLNILLNNE